MSKDYEHKVNGRVLCINHGLLRCSECDYVYDLEQQNKRYRGALKEIRKISKEDYFKTDIFIIADEALEESE